MNASLAPQATAVVGHSGIFRSIYPLEATATAVREDSSGWFQRSLRFAGFGRRFYIVEMIGNCLEPVITDRFAIVDRKADVRAGDLFLFRVRDWATAYGHLPSNVTGTIKRFRGVNHEKALLECDCTTPPWVIHTGLTNVLCMHRVRATAPTRWSAIVLLCRVRLNPAAYDARLMH